MLNAELSNQL